MALTYLLENIFQIFSGRTANSVGLGFSKYLRSVVYDKVQRMSVSSMSRKTAGDLIKRVTRDTNTVQNFFVDKGRYALEQIILFIVVGIFMLRMSAADSSRSPARAALHYRAQQFQALYPSAL